MSEDPKRPERKIQFFVAVYQHLRERIRQMTPLPLAAPFPLPGGSGTFTR